MYRETHILLDELAEAVAEGTRREFMETLTAVPLLIIDDFGMRKLPLTAAEDLLEIIMRRYERASTLLTSNRPVENRGKLLGDVAAITAMLDRLLHHGHVLKCGLVAGARKLPWPPPETRGDPQQQYLGLRLKPSGGCAPATAPKPKPFNEGKTRTYRPSRGSGSSREKVRKENACSNGR